VKKELIIGGEERDRRERVRGLRMAGGKRKEGGREIGKKPEAEKN